MSDEVEIGNVLSIFVQLWDLHIIVCYRPPSYSAEENNQVLSFLSDFCSGRPVVILGDFNLSSLKWLSDGIETGYITPIDRSFYEWFLDLGLHQYVHSPTFIPSGNILDLVFSSDPELVGEVVVLAPLPSCHHCPIVVELFLNDPEAVSNSIQLWFKGNYRIISEELAGIDGGWSSRMSLWMIVLQSFLKLCLPLSVGMSQYLTAVTPIEVGHSLDLHDN